MRVTLYKYTGDSDTANKLLRDCSVIYNKEVVPYGAFNPNGAAFRLDTLYDVNYAKFTYNGHDYYGFVDVSTDSKGIYNYTITTDPLTTAWYAGCFNSSNKVLYSDSGSNNKLQDTRVAYSHGAATEYVGYFEPKGYRNRPAGSFNGNYIVMVVLNTTYNLKNDANTQNRAFDVYIMYDKAYVSLMKDFQSYEDKKQKAYAGCIIKLYTISNAVGWYLTKNLTPQTSVNFYTVNASITGVDQQTTQDIYNPWIYKITFGEVQYYPFEGLNINNLNATNFQDSLLLSITDCGIISIRPTDVIETINASNITGASSSKLTFRRYYDFVGGQQSVIPYITLSENSSELANIPLYQYRTTTPIPSSFPFMFDSSITNWYSVAATTTLGVMSTVANTVAQNYVGATASSIGAIGSLAGNIQEAKYGTASISGSTGGSLSTVELRGDEMFFVHRTPTNINDIQAKFGKPDGLVRVISNLKGWVQTEACELPSNGLPFGIVKEAEKLSDKGFRIVS